MNRFFILFICIILFLPMVYIPQDQTVDLSTINWEDADSFTEDDEKETEIQAAFKLENKKNIQKQHIYGVSATLIYLFGLFFTILFYKRHPLRIQIAPELLIILHVFWFFEVILNICYSIYNKYYHRQ